MIYKVNCLIFTHQFDNKQKLKEHYINFHNVDPVSCFFQKLLKPINQSYISRKYLQCQDFLKATKFKVIHDFLKYYNDGKFDLFEEKPIDISQRQDILTSEISVQKHKDYYDLENSEELVEDFLKNVSSEFKPGCFLVMKCSFSTENYQPGPIENYMPIINTWYWSTEPYRAKFFNGYIFFSLKENILRRVIVNGMGGSSWGFRKFLYINLKVTR